MWYVMQTITGKEQELADVIWRVLTGERNMTGEAAGSWKPVLKYYFLPMYLSKPMRRKNSSWN